MQCSMQRLWENGMLRQWSSSNTVKTAEKCLVLKRDIQENGDPIKLIDLSSPTALLISGLVLSAFGFFFETAFCSWAKKCVQGEI